MTKLFSAPSDEVNEEEFPAAINPDTDEVGEVEEKVEPMEDDAETSDFVDEDDDSSDDDVEE